MSIAETASLAMNDRISSTTSGYTASSARVMWLSLSSVISRASAIALVEAGGVGDRGEFGNAGVETEILHVPKPRLS
ncbi:hypothetical protein [Gordonia jinhuaensis]|uniref:hypothetical protein n=1 Tax=Gordonia jinhuaensis TaxID=1517702 RepID=UPI001E48C423|nr:hypothetical protein [Gordonia jinhuaensis]